MSQNNFQNKIRNLDFWVQKSVEISFPSNLISNCLLFELTVDHVKAASVLKSKQERCGLNNEAAVGAVHQPLETS